MEMNEVPKRKRGRPSLAETLDLNDILVAALGVFAEKGFDGAQLKDVAQRVGVTNPLISYRFENKADLWKNPYCTWETYWSTALKPFRPTISTLLECRPYKPMRGSISIFGRESNIV